MFVGHKKLNSCQIPKKIM